MSTQHLSRAPRLLPAFAKGVLTGAGKRPGPTAPLPATRLVLPAARINPAGLIAYARVCGYQQTDPLPLTYPHILGFPLAARLMAARTFPLPLLGLVHTSIEITQHTPLSAEDPVELTVYAEKLRPHRRGTEVVMVTEVHRDGALVWQDRSAYLSRHATRSTPSGPEVGAPPVLPPSATWPLASDLGRRHAAVSGDYNPIHLHSVTARPLGFRRAIAHGMWTFARCVAETGTSSAQDVTVRAEFKAPVMLPGRVTYATTGSAFELRDAADSSRLHLTGRIGTAGRQRPRLDDPDQRHHQQR